MSRLSMARNRTDAKLRFAGVHLSELNASRRDDCDFDMAHQESFLFHLFGIRDSLLQEISQFHSSGLAMDQVRKADLKARLAKLGITSPALKILDEQEEPRDSMKWLAVAGRMRHYLTHCRDIPRTYYSSKQKGNNVCVRLLDPQSGQEIKGGADIVDQFDEWLRKMKQLVGDLRAKMPGAENG